MLVVPVRAHNSHRVTTVRVLRVERSGGRAIEHPIEHGTWERVVVVIAALLAVIDPEPDDDWFVIEQQRR